MVAEHASDLPPAVDPTQRDLPAHHEAEGQNERGVFTRSEPCGFDPALVVLMEVTETIVVVKDDWVTNDRKPGRSRVCLL